MGTSFLLKFCTVIQASLYFWSASSSHAVATRKVTTAKHFQHALDKANPGDVIQIDSNEIFFEGGEFIASKSGMDGKPITIIGTSQHGASATIQGDTFSKKSSGTTALTISGDYWKIEGIEIMNHEPYVGIRVNGNNNYLSSLIITAAETGIYLNGYGNTVIDSVIKATEGTAIYLKGGGQNVTWNTVEGRDWAMYFEGPSCCDFVISNTVKGPVMVQGSNHYLEDNIITGDLLVADCDNNKFSDVFVYSKNNQGQFEDNCKSVDAGVLYLR